MSRYKCPTIAGLGLVSVIKHSRTPDDSEGQSSLGANPARAYIRPLRDDSDSVPLSEQDAPSSFPVRVVSPCILQIPLHSSETETHYTKIYPRQFLCSIHKTHIWAHNSCLSWVGDLQRDKLQMAGVFYTQSCQKRGFIFISSQFMWCASNHTEQTASLPLNLPPSVRYRFTCLDI